MDVFKDISSATASRDLKKGAELGLFEKIGEKTYYNTGDFCETCSFLYEDLDGEIKLIVIG